jgi:hypothetical protein
MPIGSPKLAIRDGSVHGNRLANSGGKLHFILTTLFSGKTEGFNADFHRLRRGNDDRDASFSMPQKHDLFLYGTIPDHPIHMS